MTTAKREGRQSIEPTPAGASPPLRRQQGRLRLRYTLPGATVAVLFACLSFTPSLLPRSGILQGVVCGVTAAIGYGLGVLGAAVWPVRNIGTETGANDDLSLVQARKPAVARGRPVRSLGSQRMRRSRI